MKQTLFIAFVVSNRHLGTKLKVYRQHSACPIALLTYPPGNDSAFHTIHSLHFHLTGCNAHFRKDYMTSSGDPHNSVLSTLSAHFPSPWCKFPPKNMGRQSISFTEPNDEWLKAQVESHEYSSKSELVNDLIRQARKQQQEVDYIRMKLEKAEQSHFTTDSPADILKQAKFQ